MVIEIRMFGEIFGTITDFNSALGMVLRSRVRIWPITFFFFNVFGEVRTQIVKHRKGVYEGYFQTVNGPIPFKVHSPEVANQNSQISRIISFLGISTKTERSSKNQQIVKILKTEKSWNIPKWYPANVPWSRNCFTNNIFQTKWIRYYVEQFCHRTQKAAWWLSERTVFWFARQKFRAVPYP